MDEETERLSRDVANDAASWQVEQFYSHLPIEQRLRIHTQFYDSALSAIWAFWDVAGVRRIPATFAPSEN